LRHEQTRALPIVSLGSANKLARILDSMCSESFLLR
jgi:hypothetical protein